MRGKREGGRKAATEEQTVLGVTERKLGYCTGVGPMQSGCTVQERVKGKRRDFWSQGMKEVERPGPDDYDTGRDASPRVVSMRILSRREL